MRLNSGPEVWRAQGDSLRTSYDEDHDILHLAKADFRSAEDEEVEDGVFLGFDEDGTEPKSATIFRFRARESPELHSLAARLSEVLHIGPDAIERAFCSP